MPSLRRVGHFLAPLLGCLTDGRPDGYDVPMARDLLARRIINAALEQGEFDLERRKAYALAGFKS
jgi:hypothetical protein